MNGRAPVQGRVRVTSFSTLAGWALAGLVLGRALRPVAQWLDRHPPVVAWSQPAVLGFVAVVLAVTAWSTKQALERPHGLEPQQAVNRLVLAKACALVGALLAGGYAGYALGWVGSEAALAGQRILRSAVAAVLGLLMCAAALWLERCCRIKGDDPDPPPAVEPDPAA